MFVFALCLLGTALALPAIPPAPILPIGGDVIVSGPKAIVPYAMAPMFSPFRNLEFKIEKEPKEEELKEFTEEKKDLELEKKEEEEPKIEEVPKAEEEPKKPIELKPETVYITFPKAPAFIDNLFSYLPFSVPSSISSWFGGGERSPTRYVYPGYSGVPSYVIVEKPKA